MRSYLRIQSPGVQLLLFLGLFLVCNEVAYMFLRGTASLQTGHIDLSSSHMINQLKKEQAIYTVIGFLMPALLFGGIVFRYRHLHFLGFRPSYSVIFYIFAVVIMIVSFPLVSWLGEINQRIPLSRWMVDTENEATKLMEAFLKTNSTAGLIINVLLIGLLPAIGEEACFRGVMQRIFIGMFKNAWVGIIISSMLFSAFHLEFAGFLPRMFLGLLLGALYWYSGSIWVSIVAHFFNNAAQIILIQYNPKVANENPAVPIYAAVASALIVWGILLLIKRNSKSTIESEYGVRT
ncbi:MAG TPA: type II CAAX endopeptidase family protein [Puia sp.]|nr:type II CAAX endopeptidase family protein [Puia sp.]